MLLIESGVRFHTTTFYTTSDTSTTPSPFAMKLRKHLRNLRLENVTQLGNMDRVVDFRFGSGEYAHHLILELYCVGNIILTNEKNTSFWPFQEFMNARAKENQITMVKMGVEM